MATLRWSLRRRWVVAGVALAAVAGSGVLAVLKLGGGGPRPLDEGEEKQVQEQMMAAVTADQLRTVAGTKVFFGHQSVGGNLLDALPAVYAAHDVTAPTVAPGAVPAGATGYVRHAFIGENTKPEAKIADFDAKLRSGIGNQVDVAMMKLCYVDLTADTDVNALFEQYRTTLAQLQRDYPKVKFVHVTVPLTTERALTARVKALLGRSDEYGPAENATRERLNALIRKEYGGDRLFDLAAIESTGPDGSRVSGSDGGQAYYALFGGYATDVGHLNPQGAGLATARLLKVIAGVSGG